MPRKTTFVTALALAFVPAAFAGIDETVSEGKDRKAVALTIYNKELALIRENRILPLNKGANRIALRDVAARIMPETVNLQVKGNTTLDLLEQNFDYDLLSAQSLLGKYVGKKVTTIRTNPASGEETREEATVLANNDGVVLQYADRIETGLPANIRLAFADVPTNLRDHPTLTVDLQSDKDGSQEVDLSYLSGGFSWQADYVASLATDESALDLAGWVTLDNQSGSSYDNATLQLVAGDVNRVTQNDTVYMERLRVPVAPLTKEAAWPMEEEPLFEYHLYTLSRPTSLKNNQKKQVSLLSTDKVAVQKEYRLQGSTSWYYRALNDNTPELGDKRKVDVFVEFTNDEKNQLGLPLPKGIVRVYKNDSDNRAQFIGEDQIDHTAKNDKVRLKLGSAFDVNGVWKKLAVKTLNNSHLGQLVSGAQYEAAFSIELNNAKKEAVTVKVVEPMIGNWKIVEESHKHEKVGSNIAQWQVAVPAEGKTELKYKVQFRM